MKKSIFFILFISFLIRFISLNQSLWLDEATTAKVVQTYSYLHIITKFSPFDFHPPLYYIMMKFWTSIFGITEISLRMPSIIFSIFTGFVIYEIGKLLKNKTVGFWSVVFFLFNPLIVYYSQEARQYMMVTFFLTASLYYLLFLLTSSRVHELRKVLLFNLFCILSFFTFYGSIFLIVPLLLILLYAKKYKEFIISFLILISSFLILSPLLYQQFIHARQSLQIVLNWRQVLGTVSIKNLVLIPLKFTSGRISFNPKFLYYIFSGLWAGVVWFYVCKGGLKNKRLFILLIIPLVLGLLFSFFSPLLQYFRFLYLISIMSILLAFGIEKQKVQHVTVYRYVVAIGFLVFSLLYLFVPQFHREDWKSLSRSLSQARFVYMIIPSSDPIKYYLPETSIRELRLLEGIELEHEVLIVPYTADIYGFDYKKELHKKGFTYKETKSFRGVWYEVWVRNKDYAGSFWYSLITARI